MQSTASDVSAYLNEVPAERKAAVAKLRALCCTVLKGFEESMLYGGPCYSRNGAVEVGFASAHRAMLDVRGVSLGKGCIRYSRAEKSDFKVVEMVLKATRKSTGEICGHNAYAGRESRASSPAIGQFLDLRGCPSERDDPTLRVTP